MEALQEQSIRADRSRPTDITPVIDQLRSLGSNDTMSLPDLTAYLSWLLGVSGLWIDPESGRTRFFLARTSIIYFGRS